MSRNRSVLNPNRSRHVTTHSNQLVTDATAVLAFLQPTDWIVDDLAATSQLCCVVPVVDKELAFEQAETESLLQTVAFR